MKRWRKTRPEIETRAAEPLQRACMLNDPIVNVLAATLAVRDKHNDGHARHLMISSWDGLTICLLKRNETTEEGPFVWSTSLLPSGDLSDLLNI